MGKKEYSGFGRGGMGKPVDPKNNLIL